jgi:hypothetical protein
VLERSHNLAVGCFLGLAAGQGEQANNNQEHGKQSDLHFLFSSVSSESFPVIENLASHFTETRFFFTRLDRTVSGRPPQTAERKQTAV